MLRGKKAIGIDDAIPLIIFIFVAAFGIIFLKISEKSRAERSMDDIQLQKDMLQGQEVLMGYLRKSDADGNKADVIARAYLENNYGELMQDMRQYFDGKFSNIAWEIQAETSPRNSLFSLQSSGYYLMEGPFEVGRAIVPINSGHSDYITIKLIFRRIPMAMPI